jgi:hypothetical protein
MMKAPRLYNYTFTGVITFLVVSVFCSKSIPLTIYYITELITTVKSFTGQVPRLYDWDLLSKYFHSMLPFI